MLKKQHRKFVPLAIVYGSLCLLFLVFTQPGWAAPLPQNAPQADDGQEYVVQTGDSLYAISERFYGQPNAYNAIVAATNAKAESDPRFSHITNPSRIQAGQRLWLPNTVDLPLITATPNPEQPTPTASRSSTETATTTATTTTIATATTSAITPSVRFVTPVNGATVPPTFTVAMTASGLLIEPAGEIHDGAGHFHILVDTDFVTPGEVIVNDAQHRHYGKGQITATLHLEPGVHVLRLQFANGAHIALDGPAYQDTITVTVSAAAATSASAGSGATPAVHFVTPLTGATVPPTFTVAMTASGLLIEPAGEIHEGAGHFHILVDTDFVTPGEVIINDAQHRHYGKGQITATLHLEPGVHVLRLQFADGAHIALDGPAYQDTITVTVSPDAAGAPPASEATPSVHFVTPLAGATVPPTFTVAMTATGLTVEPAGAIHDNAGHFHILVDTDFVEAGEIIMNDAQHRHYGKGQYTTTLNLTPGVHVLHLQFANGAHIALEGPAYQDTITVTVSAAAATSASAGSGATPAVQFVTPLNGATVPPTFTVAMTATGLLIEPAGEIHEGAGHFHILVDTDFVTPGEVIINDAHHRHYGKGQTSATLHLEPGVHVLRLQFADGAHIALDGPTYQDTITVTVSAAAAAKSPESSPTPAVHFVTPLAGATVPAKFAVEMAATGLTVEPAGEIHDGAGHFHILVDTDFVDAGEVISNDAQHLHYGKGQYTTTLELPPGEHVLRLQFANGAHIALAGAAYRDAITVTVK